MIPQIKILVVVLLSAATAALGFCSTTPAKKTHYHKSRHVSSVRSLPKHGTPSPAPNYAMSSNNNYLVKPDGSWSWIPEPQAEQSPKPTPKPRPEPTPPRASF